MLTNLTDVDLILALDAGTSGVRTVAFDGSGRVVHATHRELAQHFPQPGRVEQDVLDITSLAVATLREVASVVRRDGHRVLALGVTNQRETTVAFDRATGIPCGRAIVWQDRRTAPRCQELARDGHAPRVRSRTGLVLDPYFSATKMQWVLERGLLDDAREPSLATVDSWLLWWLTGGTNGGVFATEPSNASRTSLMDLATLEWSSEMTDLFAVPSSTLASIRPSAHHFGSVHADVVPELANVPITAVLGDQQAALFGQACFSPGVIKATYGTGAFLLVNAGEHVPGVFDGLLTTVAWDLGELGPTIYALEGSAFVAGAAVEWWRELGLIEAADQLEPLARSVPDSAGVRFVPALTGLGSPFWRSDARGSLTGLSRGAGRGHVARAVVDGLVFQVRAMTDAFLAAGATLHEVRADGGAAAMDLLLELQAVASRLPVLRGRSLEATARGAATLAGLQIGLWESLEELGELWEFERRFEPGGADQGEADYQSWLAAVAAACAS